MHVRPGIIRSIFEYLSRKSPLWSLIEKLLGISFDEMYIDTAVDIDKLLDMPINPNNHKNAQIIIVRQLCGDGKWPFFVDTDYAVTPNDIVQFVMDFEACGLTLLSLTCDQGRVIVHLFLVIL